MAIAWQARLSIGESRIDLQHRGLFAEVAKLEAELAKESIDSQAVDMLFRFLELYARNHFGYEEECMRRHRCPAYRANVAAHEAFLELFEQFRQDYLSRGPDRELLTRLCQWMSDWLVNHICKVDIRLRACLPRNQ